MSSATYNPYYISSLDAMKAQARQEAEAQINASIAAVPTDAATTTMSNETGRDLRGFDQSFIDFLAKQRTASLAHVAPPSYVPNGGTAGTANTNTTSAEAQNAGAASAMLGIGFANQQEGLQNAAAAGLDARQSANRRSLNDTLLQLAQQRAAEKAKQPALEFDILNQKKTNAFNAYNAYLANQLSAATAGATASFNQGKLDVSQQNANTSQQNAATNAAKAATNGTGGATTTKARNTLLNNTYKYLDTSIAKTVDTNSTEITASRWQASEVSGFPPTTKNVGPVVELPPGTTDAQAAVILKKSYPNLSAVVHVDDKTKDITRSVHHSYEWLLSTAVRKLVAGNYYSKAKATSLVKAYLKAQGIKPTPSTATPSGSR